MTRLEHYLAGAGYIPQVYTAGYVIGYELYARPWSCNMYWKCTLIACKNHQAVLAFICAAVFAEWPQSSLGWFDPVSLWSSHPSLGAAVRHVPLKSWCPSPESNGSVSEMEHLGEGAWSVSPELGGSTPLLEFPFEVTTFCDITWWVNRNKYQRKSDFFLLFSGSTHVLSH